MIVLYTALLGGSDRLKPAPAGVVDRCVCYTDDLTIDPQGWELVGYQALIDARREAWRVRCHPEDLFHADTVIWLDASLEILDLPRLVADAAPFDLAGLRHPERSSPYDEATELLAIGQGDAESLKAQVAAYRAEGFPGSMLTTSGILIRRMTPAVLQFNAFWSEQIERYRGDNTQVSLDYAAWRAGVPMAHLAGTYIDTPYIKYDHEEHHRRRRPYR